MASAMIITRSEADLVAAVMLFAAMRDCTFAKQFAGDAHWNLVARGGDHRVRVEFAAAGRGQTRVSMRAAATPRSNDIATLLRTFLESPDSWRPAVPLNCPGCGRAVRSVTARFCGGCGRSLENLQHGPVQKP